MASWAKSIREKNEETEMDVNENAKRIIDLATGQTEKPKPEGRQLSGKARAAKLTPERRREIARKAAAARWASA